MSLFLVSRRPLFRFVSPVANCKCWIQLTTVFFVCYLFQAALAPVALDMVRKLKSEGNYEYANIVLIIGVIAIVLTAPIGAVLMVKFAPKWLKGPQSLNQPHRIDVETLPMH